ncbi:hypothetical protein DFH28DRAFT_1219915 [Melampsora americana]|nr:hypothetical protein DFH28DRAFT_1219915 [Melampsora americana]
MFSSKHLQQSIHLSNEALNELNKPHQDQVDQAYIVDCYLSSLDYFIGALPDDIKLSDFPGSVHRQILLRSKLESLMNCQNDLSTSSSDTISVSIPSLQTSQSSWKSYFIPKILTRKFNSNPNLIESNMNQGRIEEVEEFSNFNEKGKEILSSNSQEIQDSSSSSQWNSKCKCGREISIKIPNCLIEETHVLQNQNQNQNQSIHYWTHLILNIMITSLIWIKESHVYQYFKIIIFNMMNFLIYLESKFKLIEKCLNLIGNLIEMILKLDDEFGLWNGFIKGFVWFIELVLRIVLVFTFKGIEGYQSNQLYLLNPQSQSQLQPHSHFHSRIPSNSLDQSTQTKLIYLHQSIITRLKSLLIIKSN